MPSDAETAPPLLEITRPGGLLPRPHGLHPVLHGIDLTVARGRAGRDRRRVRVGQVDDRRRGHQPAARQRRGHRRDACGSDGEDITHGRRPPAARAARRGRSGWSRRTRCRTSTRPPASASRSPRRCVAHGMAARQRGQGACRRAAGRGRHPRRRAPGAAVPARVLRRHAAARAHRDRAGLRARAADRRRADVGARRDRAAADPRPPRGAARPHGDLAAVRHARPRAGRGPRRPGRGHVAGPGRGERPAAQILREPQHEYTRRLVAAAPSVATSTRPGRGRRRRPPPATSCCEAAATARPSRRRRRSCEVARPRQGVPGARSRREQLTAVDDVSFDDPRRHHHRDRG